MEILTSPTEYQIVGNELWRIIILGIIIALSFILGKLSKFILKRFSKKTESMGRLALATSLKSSSDAVTFLIFSFGLSIAFRFIIIPEGVEGLIYTTLEILIVLAIGYYIYRQVDVFDIWLRRFSQEDSTSIDDMLIPIVGKSLRIVVVILIILQCAQTLSDQPITSILAGIGIGGLALGLAAQDTIRNFFGSLMIFADKPFNVGELINLDDKLGSVLEVGVRTTKVRTLDGHLLTVPNGNLANMTIHNIGKREYIRRVFSVTITYDTTPDKVDEAIKILKRILDNHEGMEEDFPPRVYFNEFNKDSLNLVCYYWFHPPDFWKYMDFTEWVNREVFRRFNDAGIDFAFPTQTIHLAGDKKRPINFGVKSLDDDSDESQKKEE